jgi:guanine deaminase
MDKNDFMKEALKEAREGVVNNDGGPFGAVIVKDGKIVVSSHNEVIASFDPTAHAEILAIRRASEKLGRFDLSDCEIYSTCEPCPMCFAAIHWAKIKTLYFGCTKMDAADIGFDDKFIYDVIKGETQEKKLFSYPFQRDDCLLLFEEWKNKEDKMSY